jgi:hypothetical protein
MRKGKLCTPIIMNITPLLHKKTTYLENVRGRKATAEYYYNNLPQLIKKRSHTIDCMPGPFDVTTTYSYNPDETLFESKESVEGQRIEWIRHYYFK